MNAQPRYRAVKELIIGRILDGSLKPHDRVPSENELVVQTGVSRMTANRALRELTDEGYLERVAGVGTFVADLKAASHPLEVRNIADEIRSRGHRHSARVVSLDAVDAGRELADALRIRPGEQAYRALVVHLESGVPIQLEDRYVLPAFAPRFLEQDYTATTPAAHLSDVAPLQEAEHVVRAVLPDAEVARHLDMHPAEPCLLVVRRTWAGGRPVSYGRLHHPGDRFELTGHYVPPGVERSADAG